MRAQAPSEGVINSSLFVTAPGLDGKFTLLVAYLVQSPLFVTLLSARKRVVADVSYEP